MVNEGYLWGLRAPSSNKERVAEGVEEGHAHISEKVEEKEVLQVA